MAHVFISYSKQDIVFARYLRHELENAGLPAWMDETKLIPSQRWWPTIEQNILTCSAFIVIMSPRSRESEWVEREILLAEKRSVRKPIFPVLLEGEPWSRLANIQYADMSAGVGTALPPLPGELLDTKTPVQVASMPVARHFPLAPVSGVLITAILIVVGLVIGIPLLISGNNAPTSPVNVTNRAATLAALNQATTPTTTLTWLPSLTPTLQLPKTFSGHILTVESVAFAPDGKTFLTASNDKTARLWDVQSGQTLRTFTGHAEAVFSVAFAPDGKTILTSSYDQTARLWDVQSGQTLRTFTGHTAAVNKVAFAPDGQSILTGSEDKTARLWDVQSGQTLHTFIGHTGAVYGVAFAPNGKTVLTGSEDKTARLWDVQSGQTLHTFIGHID